MGHVSAIRSTSDVSCDPHHWQRMNVKELERLALSSGSAINCPETQERLLQQQRFSDRIKTRKIWKILCLPQWRSQPKCKRLDESKSFQERRAQHDCSEFINNQLLPSSHLPPFFFHIHVVSLRTAVRWLQHLGFKPRSHKKGVYIDYHKREDAV